LKRFGLVGFPLEHSFSLKYFQEKFTREFINDAVYELFPLENISLISKLLKSTPDLVGLNVTIPYKEKIFSFLQAIDNDAKEIGAVNCVKIFKDKQNRPLLKGYNTDAMGFKDSIIPLLNTFHQNALILGNGGGAKAVSFILKKLNIKYLVVTRTPTASNHISYSEITDNIIKQHLLIINTTPLGMFPNIYTFPDIPYQYLTDRHLLYDLIYNPFETLFLTKGRLNGTQIKNGLSMLHLQAEKSWDIWCNAL